MDVSEALQNFKDALDASDGSSVDYSDTYLVVGPMTSTGCTTNFWTKKEFESMHDAVYGNWSAVTPQGVVIGIVLGVGISGALLAINHYRKRTAEK